MNNFFTKLIKNYFIIALGFIIFSIYIFYRFLRERLPKDIPFNLSVLGFFLLLEICCIYAYIVWFYIKPNKDSNVFVTAFIDFIFEPLDKFDSFIKSLPIIKTYYPKFIFWFSYKFEYFFKTSLFEIILFFFPCIILIVTFMINIFYFHKLENIYKVIFEEIYII